MLSSGHLACGGCGSAIAMRLALETLGRRTVIVIPACCWSVIDGVAPYSALGVPVMHTPFASAAAAATGVRAALDRRGEDDVTVCVWAGDGGTFDIGLQALSAAAERNENFLYICYDNEAYMNTGVQRSSATPFGAGTTTSPGTGKLEPKKDLLAIVAAHGVPYAATASIAWPDDLAAKLRRARAVTGFRFLHLLAPCPPGWKFDADRTLHYARLAVASGVFPLVEVIDGRHWIETVRPDPVPLDAYLAGQGRFATLAADPVRLEHARALVRRHRRAIDARTQHDEWPEFE